MEAPRGRPRHVATVVGSSDALTLQDALEAFGRRHQRPGDALEEAGRACTKASAALAQGEPVEGLWSLAETLSSIDDVEVKQVHGHLADVLEADLARRQYDNANELRKKYEALAEAQNALAQTLAEVSGREAPQITITADDRPPTPEVIVDRQSGPGDHRGIGEARDARADEGPAVVRG